MASARSRSVPSTWRCGMRSPRSRANRCSGFSRSGRRAARKRDANPRVFVYAAGGYYYPGKGIEQLRAEMRSYLDRGYTVVKMKIGNSIEEDQPRIEGVLKELNGKAQLCVDANGRLTLEEGIM